MEDQAPYGNDTTFESLVKTIVEQQSKYQRSKGIHLAINLMIDEQQRLMLDHANQAAFDKVDVLQKMIDKLTAHLA